MYGVISADIIGSTSLDVENKIAIINEIKTWMKLMKKKFKAEGRIIKGDNIEIVIPAINSTMLIALLLKTKVKSLDSLRNIDNSENISRYKAFKEKSIRMVVTIDELERFDLKNGIIEGEAIYTAGRELAKMSTHEKQRVVIKNSMIFKSSNKEWEEEFSVAFGLIDFILSKSTSKQNEVLMMKLLGYSEAEVANELSINQSAVNQFLTSIATREIEKAVKRFEKTIKE